MRRRQRILFFAEAVTLAHLARPIALSRRLDPDRFECVIACDPRCAPFVGTLPTLPLQSIDPGRFLRSLERGSPVYDIETLREYAREDFVLIDQVDPDLVIGDFRLSLSVSARVNERGKRRKRPLPYAAVTNAYWSPHSSHRHFPLPVLPMTKMLPISMAELIFRCAQPVAFAMHCRPLNALRKEYGMSSLGHDLRRVYTNADHVLYADVPAMFRTQALPDSHHFIGPVPWSPSTPKPDWWNDIPSDRPVVYLTLGSSGQTAVMQMALDALADLPVTVLASTAGAEFATGKVRNAYVSKYLPGDEACALARLVVCNGGSPTSQQAIAAGIPVLGIASNMDQFMNMEALTRVGAGRLLRADRISPTVIRDAASQLLRSSSISHAAVRLRQEFDQFSAQTDFQALVETMLSPCGA